MSDIRAYVANFLGRGDKVTKYEDKWIRDSLLLDCDGFTFQFIQSQEISTGKLEKSKGRFTASSEVLIRDVKKKDVEKALIVLNRICWLLSFASLSCVRCYGHEYPAGTGRKRFSTVVGEASYFRPSIDIQDGKQTIEFIEKCYNGYKQWEEKRKLNVVIDYLVLAERSGQPTELMLIIAFVVLENLKDTFARSIGIPYKKGFFRKIPKPKIGRDEYSFEELLHLMLREVRMQKGLKRVKKLRNEIIHSGLTRKAPSWQWKRYEWLHDLLREYIFRLLGYRGNFPTYASAGMTSKRL